MHKTSFLKKIRNRSELHCLSIFKENEELSLIKNENEKIQFLHNSIYKYADFSILNPTFYLARYLSIDYSEADMFALMSVLKMLGENNYSFFSKNTMNDKYKKIAFKLLPVKIKNQLKKDILERSKLLNLPINELYIKNRDITNLMIVMGKEDLLNYYNTLILNKEKRDNENKNMFVPENYYLDFKKSFIAEIEKTTINKSDFEDHEEWLNDLNEKLENSIIKKDNIRATIRESNKLKLIFNKLSDYEYQNIILIDSKTNRIITYKENLKTKENIEDIIFNEINKTTFRTNRIRRISDYSFSFDIINCDSIKTLNSLLKKIKKDNRIVCKSIFLFKTIDCQNIELMIRSGDSQKETAEENKYLIKDFFEEIDIIIEKDNNIGKEHVYKIKLNEVKVFKKKVVKYKPIEKLFVNIKYKARVDISIEKTIIEKGSIILIKKIGYNWSNKSEIEIIKGRVKEPNRTDFKDVYLREMSYDPFNRALLDLEEID